MLSKTIDNLFVGTRYGVWALALIGILGSIILTFVNITVGLTSALTCIAILCLSFAVTLGLLPTQLIKGELLKTKRIPLAIITLLIAIAIMGIIYFIAGGFPELNLIFA